MLKTVIHGQRKKRVSYTARIHVIKAADAQRIGAESTGPCTANQQASSPAKRGRKEPSINQPNKTKKNHIDNSKSFPVISLEENGLYSPMKRLRDWLKP